MKTEGLVDKLATGGQDALQRISTELLANPVTSAALTQAMRAKSRIDDMQTAALGQLNLPTAEEVGRISTRVRQTQTRVEKLEASVAQVAARLERIETKLDALVAGVSLGRSAEPAVPAAAATPARPRRARKPPATGD
jgi:hypothetical protein